MGAKLSPLLPSRSQVVMYSFGPYDSKHLNNLIVDLNSPYPKRSRVKVQIKI